MLYAQCVTLGVEVTREGRPHGCAGPGRKGGARDTRPGMGTFPPLPTTVGPWAAGVRGGRPSQGRPWVCGGRQAQAGPTRPPLFSSRGGHRPHLRQPVGATLCAGLSLHSDPGRKEVPPDRSAVPGGGPDTGQGQVFVFAQNDLSLDPMAPLRPLGPPCRVHLSVGVPDSAAWSWWGRPGAQQVASTGVCTLP